MEALLVLVVIVVVVAARIESKSSGTMRRGGGRFEKQERKVQWKSMYPQNEHDSLNAMLSFQ